MRKKIPSIVIASAVTYGDAAPAPALAQETGDNNNSIASAQSIGLGAANDPLGVLWESSECPPSPRSSCPLGPGSTFFRSNVGQELGEHHA